MHIHTQIRTYTHSHTIIQEDKVELIAATNKS